MRRNFFLTFTVVMHCTVYIVIHTCYSFLQLSENCLRCTSFFRDQNNSDTSNSRDEGLFLSETCEVYAFGSNSSHQLAMGSTEKFLKASAMVHMANVQGVSTLSHILTVLYIQ